MTCKLQNWLGKNDSGADLCIFYPFYWSLLMYIDHFPAEPLHHRVTSQLEAEGRRHQFSNCSSESVLSLGCSESHCVVSLVCFITSSLQQKHPKSLSHRESERMSPVSFFPNFLIVHSCISLCVFTESVTRPWAPIIQKQSPKPSSRRRNHRNIYPV